MMYSVYEKTSVGSGGRGDVFLPLILSQKQLRLLGLFPMGGKAHRVLVLHQLEQALGAYRSQGGGR
jgi:hypothetical protein